MTNDTPDTDDYRPRSQILVMLTGLYLFLLLMTVMSYGQPIPFFGTILESTSAQLFIVLDSLVCLHLFLGIYQRQLLTWYLLLAYNCYEVLNTLTNLLLISRKELERILARPVDANGMLLSNLVTMGIVFCVSLVIWKQRDQFNNRSPYLF